MVRVTFTPNFSQELQGRGFPIFKAARLRRGFAGHGVISSFFSNFLLPFVRKRVAPIALKTAGKAVRDVIFKKRPIKKVLKKRLNKAGKQIIEAAVSSPRNTKRKASPLKKRDIFTNL